MSNDVRKSKIEHESGIRYSKLNETTKETAEANMLEDDKKKTTLFEKFRRLSTSKKTGIISITILVALILLIIAFVFSKISRINFVNKSDFTRSSASSDEHGVLALDKDKNSGKDIDQDAIKKINSKLAKNLPSDIIFDENILNVLLIGVDSREAEEQSLSDSMILASIDLKHNKIHLNSLLRDTYVYIPNYGYSKLNSANALGGPPLLMETIEYNYRVAVSHFALVDMFSLEEIIDTIGGVEIDVKSYEIPAINEALSYYNTLINEPRNSGLLKYPGKQKLSGKQALNYGRIRSVGNSDYERTERQRRILKSIFDGAKNANIAQINEMVDKVFPLVTTNLGINEIFNLLQNVQGILKAKMISGQVPILGTFEETYIQGMACLVPDLVSNIKHLAKTVYGMSDAKIDSLFGGSKDDDETEITTEAADNTYEETDVIPSSSDDYIDEPEITEPPRTTYSSRQESVTESSKVETSQKTSKAPTSQPTNPPTNPPTTSSTVNTETENTPAPTEDPGVDESEDDYSGEEED